MDNKKLRRVVVFHGVWPPRHRTRLLRNEQGPKMSSVATVQSWTLYCCTWLLVFLASTPRVHGMTPVCPRDPPSLFRQRMCPLQVEEADAIKSENMSPWTHTPSCRFMMEIGKGKQEFCVYTSSKFNRNKGISFVATPATAATVVAAVQNSTAVLQARSRFAGGKIPYAVRDLAGRGKGVVATRPIKQFETFMEDFPSLVVDSAFLPVNTTPPAETADLFNLATDQLGDRERVLSLAVTGGERNVVADVILTNAFGLSLNERDHKGLYPDIAVSSMKRHNKRISNGFYLENESRL